MPGPDDMIERVAKALFKALDPEGGIVSESDLVHTPYDESREAWARIAEAAIRAMREPSARMVEEGESAASYGLGKPTTSDAVPYVWRSMVDAALPSPAEPR